ncbi:MAG: CopD family protein [Kangiellaceae bacterium]|nr:CopD family protein [Kangiellaceae bacterium]
MEFSIWSIWSISLKLLLYLCASIAIGGGFIRALTGDHEKLQRSIDRYWNLLVFTGIWGALSYFFVQVGAFVEEGFIGMFNMEFVHMLWQSVVGDALYYQVSGFLLIWISKMVYPISSVITLKIRREYLSAPLFVIGIALLCRSFSIVGHTAEYGWVFQLILSLHFMCITWWVGALFPLRSACRLLETQSLFTLMDGFGKLASVVVALLILSGATLVILFANGSLGIFTTAYGIILFGKFLLVGTILLIALYHKLRLVPALIDIPDAHISLERSISREIVIAILILLATATLTSVTGVSE